ncbi:MAG: hypothetical protein AB1391_00405 [Candidatus Micrarchaeota archaeon]
MENIKEEMNVNELSVNEQIEQINDAWKDICKVLFGEEIGPLKEYADYLVKYVDISLNRKKSALSGKSVITASKNVHQNAKFIRNDEISIFEKRIGNKPLDINKIKDFDSLIECVQEKVFYAGDIVLGNSKNVEKSDRCVNACYVYWSQDVYASKYIVYSDSIKVCEYLFGCSAAGETKYGIKNFEAHKTIRCLEVYRTYTSSDCYFTGNLECCNNCMFSFNLRNKNRMIGNVQFSKEEYSSLKQKLIEDIRDSLQAKKFILSIIDIIREGHE